MKRVCLLLALLMLVLATPSHGEQINITYTILSQILDSVAEQGYVSSDDVFTLSTGVYTVGIDIPEGSWCLWYGPCNRSLITLEEDRTSTQYAIYNPFSREYSNPTQLTCIYIPLREGTKLIVENGAINIQPFERLLDSW